MANSRLLPSLVVGAIVIFCALTPARAGELDCNNNGVPDAVEISGNDCNANGVLDVCENETLAPVAEVTGIRRTFPYYDEGDMAVDGDTAVVGDPLVFIPGVGARGLVYCYAFSATEGWQLAQVLSQAPQSGLNSFGNRVALDGDRLVVAAPTARPETYRYGAVYCYRRVGVLWELDQTIIGEQPGIYFGQQVAIVGDRLLIGEYNKGSGPPGANSAWPRVSAYVDRGNGFELEQRLPIRGVGGSLDHILFGNVFGVSGNILVTLSPRPIPDPNMGPTGTLHYENGATVHEWDGRGWKVANRVPLDELFLNEYVRLGFNDCLIDNEAERIILTPGRVDDNLTFYTAFVLEKDIDGWHVAHSVSQGPAFARWVEKSAAGYFFGQYELVFGEEGYTTTEHPELAGVYDRSRRSGSWWLTLISGGGTFGEMTIDEVADDCDGDGILDTCELDAGAPDVDGNRVPDACQRDCNNDGIPDESQLALGDCNGNGILDVCDVDALDPDGDGEVWNDCNGNQTPDVCEPDCDGNGVPDACDLDPADPDGDGLVASDCDGNNRPDRCDIERGLARVAAIRPSGDIAGLTFGHAMSMDGDVLAITALADDAEVPSPDRVYVYRRDGTQWREEAVIRAADSPEGLGSFGFNLAIEGDVLVIEGYSISSTVQSHYYTFEYENATWQHRSTFSAFHSFSARTDLVIDAGRLAISADSSQSVKLYELNDGVWSETQEVSLTESGGLSERIALHGDLLVAGYTANASEVFRLDGASWNHVELTRHIGLTLTGGLFARPVTDGEVVVFGNPRGGCPSTSGTSLCGAAQIYRWVGEDLLLENLLYGRGPDEIGVLPAFGMSIALAGDRLIVGAPSDGNNVGQIDVFKRESGDWELLESIASPLAPAEMAFGSEVAVSGDYLAVAANGRSYQGTTETDDDVVFIYELNRDVDDDNVFDACQPDCDSNQLPDTWELANAGPIEFAASLLSATPSCVFDLNNDGATDGLDIEPFMTRLLAGP